MKDKNLEKLRETMIGLFSPYLTNDENAIENQPVQLESFSTTNVPSLESPIISKDEDKPINLNVTINQGNKEPLSLSPFNIKTNQKNVNVNLKKNKLLIENMLSSNLILFMNSQINKTNIVREKLVESKVREKTNVLKTPMSFITKTPYNFITNTGNYSIEKLQNKVVVPSKIDTPNPTIINQTKSITKENKNDVNEQYLNFFEQLKGEDINRFDPNTRNLLNDIINVISENNISDTTIKEYNEQQINPTSFKFLSKETYLPVDLLKHEKLNFKNLKNRLVSKQKAKMIKDKKQNTKALIPAFSTGALVSSPTFALIGEKNPEMVAPIQLNIEKYWNKPIGRIDTEKASHGDIHELQPNIDNSMNSLSKSISSNAKLKENTNSSTAISTKKEAELDIKDKPVVDSNSRTSIADVSRPGTKMYDFRDLKINSTTQSVSTFLNNLKALPGRRQVHM